ncbi:hypothetical protein [Amycolatopsis sp. NPDC004625]|uniref:hypothetical protein n=1 Tax=Amycolatopsis sp. NPDC004625 TaxID=3154670 RepID=UPI00339E2E49
MGIAKLAPRPSPVTPSSTARPSPTATTPSPSRSTAAAPVLADLITTGEVLALFL